MATTETARRVFKLATDTHSLTYSGLCGRTATNRQLGIMYLCNALQSKAIAVLRPDIRAEYERRAAESHSQAMQNFTEQQN